MSKWTTTAEDLHCHSECVAD